MPARRRKRVIVFLAAIIISLAFFSLLFLADVHPLIPALVSLGILSGTGLWLMSRESRKDPDDIEWHEVVPCYISVQDADLKIVDANSLFMRDFGQKTGDFCYKAYKNNSAPCPECPVLATFEDGKIHSGEETVIGRDGNPLSVVVTSAPLFDSSGSVSAVVEMSTNITEVKTPRKKLEQTRRDYKRLFEAVPCYICVLDRNLEILEANTLYERDFELAENSHCYQACKGREEPCTECLVQETFQDGEVHSSEERLTTKDGRELSLVVHSMPIRDEDRKIKSVMEVFTDITDVKRLQNQLTQMGRAVAGMAHRIKNILMGLEGGIFVVNTGMETDDQETISEGWEMVERNVSKVSRLVKDLLYCSKERQQELVDDVDPGKIVREVHSLYSKRAADAGVSIELAIESPIKTGTYDPDGIHNLLSNLVANALDACKFDTSPNKKKHIIELRCRQLDGNSVQLEVEDNGGGIPEDVQERVFEDFFSTKGTEGTGIGLLVVQKVAEEHGGSVNFTSRPGLGTKFTVTIPSAKT